MSKNNKWENKEDELEQAKELIEQFCQAEYGVHADFNNLEKVDIAYTTTEEDIPVQVSVDLIHCSMKYFLDDKLLKSEQYENLSELTQCVLEVLDFDELISDVILEKEILLIRGVINGLNISRELLSEFLGKDVEFISKVESGEDDLNTSNIDDLLDLYEVCSNPNNPFLPFTENSTLEELRGIATLGRIHRNIRGMNNIL